MKNLQKYIFFHSDQILARDFCVSDSPSPTSEENLRDETDFASISTVSKIGSYSSDANKPYQCKKCGRTFALKGTINRHLKYECGHEKRFQCPYCNHRSKQTSPVYAHIRRKHPGKEVYIFDLKLEV